MTVLVAESDHKRWKLPPQPPRNAAGKVPAWLRPAREAGWHRPGTETQPPIVTRHVRMSLAGAESVVTLMPVRWLAPTDYPRWTPDPAVPDTADVCELADRLDDFARVVGWAHEGSTAATGLRMLRHLVERTAKRAPKWQADRRRSWPTPHQVDTWSRELTATEAAEASHVHTWDAVRNYLPAIRAASIASDELRHHDAPPFDPAQAGYWLVTVPAMPDPRVPSPVRADPGGEVWVTTDVMRLWDDLGVHPEVHEAWTAPVVDHEGRRQFVDVVRRILDDDQAPEHVRAAVKHLYQTVHGKLRDPHQATIARPDWGHAIRDAAWCGTLRKACQAAGLLPLPARVTGGGRQRTSSPRWPIEVHTDAIAYASPVEHAEAPEGIEVGPQLGRFRHESTVTIAEWQEGRS